MYKYVEYQLLYANSEQTNINQQNNNFHVENMDRGALYIYIKKTIELHMCYAFTYQNKTFYTILYINVFGKIKLVNMLRFHEMGKSRKRYGQTEVFFFLSFKNMENMFVNV